MDLILTFVIFITSFDTRRCHRRHYSSSLPSVIVVIRRCCSHPSSLFSSDVVVLIRRRCFHQMSLFSSDVIVFISMSLFLSRCRCSRLDVILVQHRCFRPISSLCCHLSLSLSLSLTYSYLYFFLYYAFISFSK